MFIMREVLTQLTLTRHFLHFEFKLFKFQLKSRYFYSTILNSLWTLCTPWSQRAVKQSRFQFVLFPTVALLFNWIGLFAALCCLTVTIAGRAGAVSGFGLSVVKWSFLVMVSYFLFVYLIVCWYAEAHSFTLTCVWSCLL